MRKLLFRLMYIIIFIIISVIFVLLIPGDQTNYFSIGDWKLNKIKKTSSPRIIIIGGSNIAFGINSEMIQTNFNRNVVNMGIHAGLGLNFMLQSVKDNIQDGDIILIIPEYDQFSSAYYGIEGILAQYIACNSFNLIYIENASIVKALVFNLPVIFKLKLLGFYHTIFGNKEIIYNRNTFNAYGDVTNHLNQPRKKFDLDLKIQFDSNEISNVISSLNSYYIKFLESKKVRVYFAYPSIPITLYTNNVEEINKLTKYIKKQLFFTQINEPFESTLSNELFFDTYYHLTKAGRDIRTKFLIEYLKRIDNQKILF